MKLMMPYEGLSSEHIKSHLQKYRIEWARSENEFLDCYGTTLQNRFHAWHDNMQAKQSVRHHSMNLPTPSSSAASAAAGNPLNLFNCAIDLSSSGSDRMTPSSHASNAQKYPELPVVADDVQQPPSSSSFINPAPPPPSSSSSSSSSTVDVSSVDNDRDQLEAQIKEQINFAMQCWQVEYENSATEFDEFSRRLASNKRSKLQ